MPARNSKLSKRGCFLMYHVILNRGLKLSQTVRKSIYIIIIKNSFDILHLVLMNPLLSVNFVLKL